VHLNSLNAPVLNVLSWKENQSGFVSRLRFTTADGKPLVHSRREGG